MEELPADDRGSRQDPSSPVYGPNHNFSRRRLPGDYIFTRAQIESEPETQREHSSNVLGFKIQVFQLILEKIKRWDKERVPGSYAIL